MCTNNNYHPITFYYGCISYLKHIFICKLQRHLLYLLATNLEHNDWLITSTNVSVNGAVTIQHTILLVLFTKKSYRGHLSCTNTNRVIQFREQMREPNTGSTSYCIVMLVTIPAHITEYFSEDLVKSPWPNLVFAFYRLVVWFSAPPNPMEQYFECKVLPMYCLRSSKKCSHRRSKAKQIYIHIFTTLR